MVAHCNDSSVANTRPRNRSSTCRNNCEKFRTALTAIAAREIKMKTQAYAMVGIRLNRI